MRAWLGRGDGTATAGIVPLSNAAGLLTTGFAMPPAPLDADSRTVTLQLHNSAASADDAIDQFLSIETKINEARQAFGPLGGDYVTLTVEPEGASHLVYFDVQDGALDWATQRFGQHWARGQLTLDCLPFARGAGTTLTVTGTITNTAGTAAVPGGAGQGGVFIANVPGDAPALVRVKLTDTSLNSRVINRFRIGVHARSDMAVSDIGAWLDATPNSPGTAATASTNRVGTAYVSGTVGDDWLDLADVAGASGAAVNRGEYDFWTRVKTSADMQRPTNLVATGLVNGNLQANVDHTIRVTSVDSSGAETEASDAIVKRAGGSSTNGIVLTWTATGADVANHNVYFFGGTILSYRRQATGSAAGTFSLIELSGTTADPPSVSSVAQPYLRMLLGLQSGNVMYDAPGQQMTGGSAWHMHYLGRAVVPPIPLGEGLTDQRFKVTVQHRTAVADYMPTVDLDIVQMLPPWPQVVAEYSGLNLATQREWLIETRRDGRTVALLRSKADQTEQGQADCIGELYLLPGDNLLTINADVAGGVSDVVNATYTAEITYWPRFRALRGTY